MVNYKIILPVILPILKVNKNEVSLCSLYCLPLPWTLFVIQSCMNFTASVPSGRVIVILQRHCSFQKADHIWKDDYWWPIYHVCYVAPTQLCHHNSSPKSNEPAALCFSEQKQNHQSLMCLKNSKWGPCSPPTSWPVTKRQSFSCRF